MEPIPLTKEGHVALSKELEKLKTIERPAIIEAIVEARAHGDLKENAEYHAAREKQGFIEARITELEEKLSRAQVVSFDSNPPDNVRFSATVTLSDEVGEEKTYHIVGDLEADLRTNKVSISSPIARALLGKTEGDLVSIKAPAGIKEFEIVTIRY